MLANMKTEIKILEKKNNVFFERKDLKIKIIHHGKPTPSKEEVEKIIADKFKTTPEHIIVNYIFSESGIGESLVKAEIYKKKIEKPKKEKVKPEEKPSEGVTEKEEKKSKEEKEKEEKPEISKKVESSEEKKGETQTS